MSPEHGRSDVSTVHPAAVPPGRLWAGVVVAPAAWIAQGALGWYFGYEACGSLTPSGARTALDILSVAALALAIAGGWVAWSNWGHAASERHLIELRAWDRVEFMAAGGVLVSGMFAIGIAWAALTGALLHECGGMR